MSAPLYAEFLPDADSACSVAGEIDLHAVVGILPTATRGQLMDVARARLRRQVALLDELCLVPSDTDFSPQPILEAAVASLKEVENLLRAADRRARINEGGAV